MGRVRRKVWLPKGMRVCGMWRSSTHVRVGQERVGQERLRHGREILFRVHKVNMVASKKERARRRAPHQGGGGFEIPGRL